MKIYRTTRYGHTGRVMWQRFSATNSRYAATVRLIKSSVKGYRGGVTLEVAELDDAKFARVAATGCVPND